MYHVRLLLTIAQLSRLHTRRLLIKGKINKQSVDDADDEARGELTQQQRHWWQQ